MIAFIGFIHSVALSKTGTLPGKTFEVLKRSAVSSVVVAIFNKNVWGELSGGEG